MESGVKHHNPDPTLYIVYIYIYINSLSSDRYVEIEINNWNIKVNI